MGWLFGEISLDLDPVSLVERAASIPSMVGQDLASLVSSRRPYRWVDNQAAYIDTHKTPLDDGIWRFKGDKHSVVAFDFGIKYNIMRCLTAIGAEVVVVPAATDAAGFFCKSGGCFAHFFLCWKIKSVSLAP